MFEIVRRPGTDPVRELFSALAGPEFFRTAPFFNEEGNLALDVSEHDGSVVVKADLPGFRKEDIDVQVHNGVLTIKAEHTEEKETRDERFFRRERRVGSVSRRIALPGVVAGDAATAEFRDGVLSLTIPLSEAARPKRVQIGG